MRGAQNIQEALYSYISQEDRIPQDHPVHKLREMVNSILTNMSPRFEAMYADTGRPSIPPGVPPAGNARADSLYHPQRENIDGTA